jgi:hypothetical protein
MDLLGLWQIPDEYLSFQSGVVVGKMTAGQWVKNISLFHRMGNVISNITNVSLVTAA